MIVDRRSFGRLLAGGVAAPLAAATPWRRAAAATRREIDADVAAAMVRLRGLDHVTPLLQRAKAMLIFPRIISGGFIVGGQYGEGAALDAAGDNKILCRWPSAD